MSLFVCAFRFLTSVVVYGGRFFQTYSKRHTLEERTCIHVAYYCTKFLEIILHLPQVLSSDSSNTCIVKTFQGKRRTNHVVLGVMYLIDYAGEYYPLIEKHQAIKVITFSCNSSRVSNSRWEEKKRELDFDLMKVDGGAIEWTSLNELRRLNECMTPMQRLQHIETIEWIKVWKITFVLILEKSLKNFLINFFSR